MTYTENKTLKELLENPLLKGLGQDAISKRDLSKEEFYTWTTQEIGEKIGWNDVGYGLERLYEIANRGKFIYKLYSEEECNSCFEIPMHVEGFPKTAIFVANEDELVDPEHSRMLARALDEANIPCRLEVGPTGGHGFADGGGMCMEGWPKRAIEWFEAK